MGLGREEEVEIPAGVATVADLANYDAIIVGVGTR